MTDQEKIHLDPPPATFTLTIMEGDTPGAVREDMNTSNLVYTMEQLDPAKYWLKITDHRGCLKANGSHDARFVTILHHRDGARCVYEGYCATLLRKMVLGPPPKWIEVRNWKTRKEGA